MLTVQRINSKYKPAFNTERGVNYISDPSPSNLIKRVDEICERYGFDYDEPIYKVVETTSYDAMDNGYVRLKSNKTRYKGMKTNSITYYEAKIRKVVLV